MSRRVLTKVTIDQLTADGTRTLQLQEGDIVTMWAKEYAMSRGVTLVPPAQAGERRCAPTAEQVRQAVIANLGYAPEPLDVAITNVLK